MRLDDLAGDVADVLEADARVVLALRRGEAVAPGSRAARRRGRGSTPARSRTTCRGRPGSSRGCSTDAASRRAGAPRTSRASRWRGPGRGRARPAAAGSPSSSLRPARRAAVEVPDRQRPRASARPRTTRSSSCCAGSEPGRSRRARCIRACTWSRRASLSNVSPTKKRAPQIRRSARPRCLQSEIACARAVVGAARGPKLSGPGG